MFVHTSCGGVVRSSTSRDTPPSARLAHAHARQIRLEQYRQAEECSRTTGPAAEHYPLVIVELRAHPHDALHPNHDRDHRSLICFAPDALKEHNICAIRVSPSCRFTAHVIQSTSGSGHWICLLAHHEHMRLAIPPNLDSVLDLIRSPQSLAQPVGWKVLMELGPLEATIANKCLGRCPHCQLPGVRPPLGVEGAIVGRSALLTDGQLREFSVEKPWAELAAREVGPEAHEAWTQGRFTPPLDNAPDMSSTQKVFLEDLMGKIPVESWEFPIRLWGEIEELGDVYIPSMGGLYSDAHGYLCYWRANRDPAALKLGNLAIFQDRVQPELLDYVKDMETYGVRPMGQYPPVRSSHRAYSSIQGNPERTAHDMWGDLLKGSVMLYTQRCEHLVGPLMEPRLAFATQKDVT